MTAPAAGHRSPRTAAHDRLAEKFMHKRYWEGVFVPDSMRAMVTLAFSEEEAELVDALSFAPLPVWAIARRVKRPVDEIKPLLDSLATRLLIVGMNVKGVQTYGFLNFVPGVFESQMIRARDPNNAGERQFFVAFAALYEEFYDEFLTWLKSNRGDKDIRVGRIIPIGKTIESASGVIPLASDSFEETIDRNNSFCIAEVCACRHEMELLGRGCGKPLDVCSAMGWLADFCIEKGLARRVSKQEYIETKQRAAEEGLVNMTDNLTNPLQVCSCCSCCCSALRILKDYNIPTIIVPSRYEAVVDDEKCNACAKCSRACPMDAIEWKKKQPPVRVDYARCIGCGICVTKCDKEDAMHLRERVDHTPPSKTLFDFYADRSMELADHQVGLKRRLTLGMGRALARLAPLSLSGPGYKPPDE